MYKQETEIPLGVIFALSLCDMCDAIYTYALLPLSISARKEERLQLHFFQLRTHYVTNDCIFVSLSLTFLNFLNFRCFSARKEAWPHRSSLLQLCLSFY